MRLFPFTLSALSRELVFRNLGKSPSNVLRNLTRNLQPLTATAALSSFHRNVFVGRGVREQRDPGEPGLADARANAVDESELPDRREDRALDHQLLNLEQDRLAPGSIQFDGLLLVQLVDVGVAAIGEHPAFDQVGLNARRRIAEGARTGLDDVLILLLAVFLDKGSPFDRPQFAAD